MQAAEELKLMPPDSYIKAAETVLKAAFSKEGASEDERKELVFIACETTSKIYKGSKISSRIRLCVFKCM